ncbi:MAG: hypothetical protein ACXVA9_01555 [Bdellovibrionales bacterium]
MKSLVTATLFLLSLSACGHDGGGSGDSKPTLSSRESQHKPNECPVGIVGKYQNQNEPTELPMVIVERLGVLFMTDGRIELPVNGSVIVDGGSTASAICNSGKIFIQTNEKTGRYDAVLEMTAQGFTIQSSQVNGPEKGTTTFTRIN